MSFVELPDSFPALWEPPYLHYLLQAFQASVLGSAHILTLRVLSKLSSRVWWGAIPLPHRLLSHVLFQGCRICVLIQQLFLMPKDVWILITLLLSFLNLFGCCSLKNPGNVVARLLFVFHLVHSSVPMQFKTIWSQFNITPLTYYTGVSLTALLSSSMSQMAHMSVCDGHIPVYGPVNNPFPCASLHFSCVSLEYPCSLEDLL